MSTKPAANQNQEAAKDINKILKPEPLLDIGAGEESIGKELVELIPSIKKGDALTPATWKTLKGLGWKDATPKSASASKKVVTTKKAPTPKAKKEVKSEPKKKKPGVISTIIEVLKKGKPVTKEAILAVLTKRFPDRSAESMSKTINVQVPNRIAKEQGIKVEKTKKGYVVQ